MADMATHWRRPTAHPIVTVAELLGRVTAVPGGSACTPAVCQHEPGVSVDALLRREGRRSATPDGGSAGHTRRAAVAVSTFLAAGSVVGVALSSNSTEYVLGNTAQPVDAPPVGPSAPASAGGESLAPGQQAPVLDIPASTGALAAGSGPSTDWTAVAFPPTAGSGDGNPSAAPAETSDTTADASGDDASKSDAEPRGNDNNSASDDDGDDGSRSSGSDSRDSESTAAGSTPRDDEVVPADDGSAEPAPPRSVTVVPGGVARPGAAQDGTESGEASGDGAGSVDAPDGPDTPSTAGDSTDEGTDAVDEQGDTTDTDSSADEAASDSDATSDSSSADEPDNATEDSDGGGDSATGSAA